MPELDYELKDYGVLYRLADGISAVVSRKSAQRVEVKMQRGNTLLFPETGDLGTSTFRRKLAAKAKDQFGVDLQEELGLISVGFEGHQAERKEAADEADATDNVPELVGTPYRIADGGFVRLTNTLAGEIPQRLSDFHAWVDEEQIRDDGVECVRYYHIAGRYSQGELPSAEVPAASFPAMNWVSEHWGLSAIISAGSANKDYVREAIQRLSRGATRRRVYSHTGWREGETGWIYLHAGGAVGGSDAQVELSGSLAERAFPERTIGERSEVADDARAALSLWELAPESITVPLLAATYRAALGDSDFSVHLSGPTGEGKSELAALCQQHFAPALDARKLASWESTDNFIEGQAFAAKDQVMVLDDFAPTGSSYDVQRQHRKADRVLRAKGNASGRGRMRADTTLRPDKPPRALMISTGEDIPRGQSLRARMMILELSPGSLDFSKLSESQREASSGTYARAMAGFLEWLAPLYGDLRLKDECAALRDEAATSGDSQHRRTPGIVADLALGLRYFLQYAGETGAITASEGERYWQEGWDALGEAAEAQASHQAAGEPTGRFRELLSAALASGRAHVADSGGEAPESADAWGWRAVPVGSGDFEHTEWRPQGDRIGWVDGDDLYLEPEASFAAAQKQGRDSGEGLNISGRTLHKRLAERGVLRSNEGERLTVRRTLGGARRYVLHLLSDLLAPPTFQNRTNRTNRLRKPIPMGRSYGPITVWNRTTNRTTPKNRTNYRTTLKNRTTYWTTKNPLLMGKTLPLVRLVRLRTKGGPPERRKKRNHSPQTSSPDNRQRFRTSAPGRTWNPCSNPTPIGCE